MTRSPAPGILGMYLFQGSLVGLVAAIILLARKYKNDDEDTITNAGRIARQRKKGAVLKRRSFETQLPGPDLLFQAGMEEVGLWRWC